MDRLAAWLLGSQGGRGETPQPRPSAAIVTPAPVVERIDRTEIDSMYRSLSVIEARIGTYAAEASMQERADDERQHH